MLPPRMKQAITDNPKKLANLIDLINLPTPLREFMGQSQTSRLGCFMRVWSYIKENNLQGVKGKLLKKIKSIKPVGYLKFQDRVLQFEGTEVKKINRSCVTVQEPDVIDVEELMKDLEDDEDMGEDLDNKENIGPNMAKKNSFYLKPNPEISMRADQGLSENRVLKDSELSTPERKSTPLSEIDISSFRRPDLNSLSLFDPRLLDAFHQAVLEHIRMSEAERKNRAEENTKEEEEEEQEPPSKAPRIEKDGNDDDDDDDYDPLEEFEEKCPPGGSDSVILYTTTLRGIRKTFEGCSSIRFLLESFRVLYFERDVSMHLEFREELRMMLDGKAVPPKLFIRGRYIGGAEEVLGLHEQGKLRPLFKTVPIDRSDGPCEGCGGIRFVLCFNCNGSHKVIAEDDDVCQYHVCPNCNENGLIICPLCC
ncbi:hypothetical protein F8388_002461 [Cannabis sativa]|uniref:Glutaredoxin domain-containing protein n=1 Tax=Cannabis sativa TaxID=3483 RepID=A0A7J6E6T4_CANSA|nr:hypothetical protein F8388_002461 [Cannabis sativa]